MLPLITFCVRNLARPFEEPGVGLEFAGERQLYEIEDNMVQFDQPAKSPFVFSDCFILPMPIGRTAQNLRELLEGLREVDETCASLPPVAIPHGHFQPTVEYPNDFALWADTAIQDSRLAEKLSALDPFGYENTEQLRDALIDLLEEYLWDLPYVPWVRPEFQFHFTEASTVVLHSRVSSPHASRVLLDSRDSGAGFNLFSHDRRALAVESAQNE